MSPRGFTLIELLVVIAIIGILSAVALASLSFARSKGVDAAIQANVYNSRSQAELFHENNASSYSGVCSDASSGILNMKNGAMTAGSGDVACFDSASAWAMAAQLKTNTGQYYCVDNSGTSTIRASQIATTTC